jgi:uncharacterized protein
VEYLIIAVVALVASTLSLFSGFGLGTLLMPAFALLVPVPIAITATALVHFTNNFFKVILVGHRADWGVTLRFGLPAALAAIAGALLLGALSSMPVIKTWQFFNHDFEIMLVKIVVGVLIMAFAVLELTPVSKDWVLGRRFLIAGGVLSGFFGGLSGNQGALRSSFLIKSGLSAGSFVGTTAVCAMIVDIFRLSTYAALFGMIGLDQMGKETTNLIAIGTVFAFTGSFIGSRLIRKTSFKSIRYIVASLLILVASGLIMGIL